MVKLIERSDVDFNLAKMSTIFPVVALLGARQVGKTTLAKQQPFDHYYDLENPRDLAKLEQPQLALEDLTGKIVIDEIQRKPELFTLLRYLIDQNPKQTYLVLGSASLQLLQQSSESLAGRIGYYTLTGFTLHEVGNEHWRRLWLRGGFPRSFLSRDEEASRIWRENYIRTFLERDIPQLGRQIAARALYRFWTMLSHYHGQILNYAELGRSFGISDMSIRKYIDLLESTYMLRVLLPWHGNTAKRLVKRPKIYIRDSGLFHSLMSIENESQLLGHVKLGASWEGFALEQICAILNDVTFYFWNTHSGAEADLFWQKGGKNWAVEFKYMDAPRLTKSMSVALTDLQLERLFVIYPGKESYSLHEKITVMPLHEFCSRLQHERLSG